MNNLKNYITKLIYDTIDDTIEVINTDDYNTRIKKNKNNNNYTISIETIDLSSNNKMTAIKEVKINNGMKTVIITIPMKTWYDKLKEWNRCGYKNTDIKPQMIPKEINKRFVYNTYSTNYGTYTIESLNTDIIEEFIEHEFNAEISHKDFDKYLSKNNYITFFLSPSGNILCIPKPQIDLDGNELNFHTMKDFIDNSPIIQQTIFWKIVSKIIKFLVEKRKHKIRVRTEGFLVPWFHFRIERTIERQFSEVLLNEIDEPIKGMY